MKAHELADKLDAEQGIKYAQWQAKVSKHPAATELRRLAEVNAELLEALQRLLAAYSTSFGPEYRKNCWDQARTAIAKATGETK